MNASPATIPMRSLTRLFKALADETRLRIVALLSHGELCVCHIESGLALTQSSTSRHLAVLRAADVVEAERKGTWVHYRLAPQADAECRRVLRALVAEFGRREVLRADVERLLQSKGPTSCK